MTTESVLVVHRIVVLKHGVVHWPLCGTDLPYRTTVLACTYAEPEGNPIEISYVDAVVDCMACLVKESRSES